MSGGELVSRYFVERTADSCKYVKARIKLINKQAVKATHIAVTRARVRTNSSFTFLFLLAFSGLTLMLFAVSAMFLVSSVVQITSLQLLDRFTTLSFLRVRLLVMHFSMFRV